MGIDYYSCEYCGDSFPDVGIYVSCECGRCWCSISCAKQEGHKASEILDEDGDFEDYDYDNSSCKYCREEDFEDHQLLHHAQELLGVSREQLIESYKGKSN